MAATRLRECGGGSAIPRLRALYRLIEHRFSRAETKRRAWSYLCGLICDETRSGAGPDHDGTQRLLTSARWDEEAVCADLRALVAAARPGDEGVLSVSAAGFTKRGEHSAGVGRQFCPSTRSMTNCQIGLFAVHAVEDGPAVPVDRELYLPRRWAEDQQRRQRAAIPSPVPYRSYDELVRVLLERTLPAFPDAGWVVSDLPVGGRSHLIGALRGHAPAILLAVTADEAHALAGPASLFPGPQAETAEHLWARTALPRCGDHARWLLARRPVAGPGPERHYLCEARNAPGLADTIQAWRTHRAGQGLTAARARAGLDNYEVRQWRAWYRHITLSMVAHAAVTAAAGSPPHQASRPDAH
ncbi:transposase [Actinoplanes sp. NPDC051411]|uniref:transposase n=1 Tax=Actinoplanes sp. NPDC051411 TaxID=3155522 RepID=UPI00342CB4E8